MTDTLGLLLTTMLCSASVQDRDGAKPILLNLYLRTRVRFVYADARARRASCRLGRHDPADNDRDHPQATEQRGFTVLPRRWVVERTLAWLTAHRRLARETTNATPPHPKHDPLGRDQHITRRIARGYPATRQQKHTTPSTH